MQVRSIRQALDYAAANKLRLEAVTPRALKSRRPAEARVPKGGMLVRDGRDWIALDCVPMEEPTCEPT